MPIVLDEATLIEETAAVTLARYIQIINYPAPCGFWGVRSPTEQQAGCKVIFMKSDRDMIIRSLQEAQEEIENEVDFPLSPRWFTSEKHVFGPRQPGLRQSRWELCPQILTDWGKVIEGGVRAEATIEDGATVDQTADPAVITIMNASVLTITDVSEVRVYHPDTDVEIDPSAVSIVGNTLTITIPRCRTVLAALADNPKVGWEYGDLANFEAEVDVKRVYNDPSVNADLVWAHHCNEACASARCSEYTRTACMYIERNDIGQVSVRPSTYAAGSWGASSNGSGLCRGAPDYVRLNYRAGQTPMTRQLEDAIVRLAHSKMPDEPCGCEPLQRHWKRDRFTPPVLTRERINNPFGQNDGAWFAYKQAQTLKVWKASVL